MNRPFRLLQLGLWCALLTAFGELAVRGVERGLGRYIFLARQILWMTPLADVVLFGVVSLLLWLVSLAWRPAASTRWAGTALGFLSALSILSLQPWMAWWAVLPLALGVAVQAGRLAAAHEDATLRLVRRTLPLLVTLAVVIGGGYEVRASLKERSALAALPAAPSGAPNVLVVVWDAVRSDALSLYGYDRQTTPNLEVLARRGVTFDHAFSSAPYTSPTHASLFTGRWPHELRITWQVPLDRATPTLAETLAGRGYRTGAFSANHLLVTWETALMRGFSRDQDYVASCGEIARSSGLIKWIMQVYRLRVLSGRPDVPGRRPARDIRGSVLSWLDGGDSSRPYFAFLNMYDAHDPYLPPAPFDTLFGWTPGAGAAERRRIRVQSIAPKPGLPAEAHAHQRALYDGAIASMDHELGLLLASLRQRGRLENTIIVVLADHGEAFGEHGPYTHGNNAYREELQVPLVIVYDGHVPANVRLPGVVSVRDVPATIVGLAGASANSRIPGRPLIAAGQAGDTVLAEVDKLPRGGNAGDAVTHGNVRSIIAWPWQLITTGPRIELFDLATDPAQRHNLAESAEHATNRDALLAALRRWRQDAVPEKK